ncbi:hypothetical protein ACH4S8_37250 [Streptomyces sp. NPDC021080]|uniref:hypothetical protein n=1 Tax=Streptomyces sp. NPDC021080 TaxID=3365110 RepID=UPI0037A4DB3A
MFVAVQNHSARVSDADAALMVRAVAHQVRYDVAPAWGQKYAAVVFLPLGAAVPAGSYAIGIYDDADQADALGYHSEEGDGTIYGKVFASPVLDNGGTVLQGELSVSAVLSHEVLETVVDPHVQLWASDGGDGLYAYEACDAVEDGSYEVRVGGRTVAVSNFVLPAYFDAQSPAGTRLDHLAQLRRPFEISKGGYAVKITLGRNAKVDQVFGEHFPQWKKESKRHPLARLARRAHSS